MHANQTAYNWIERVEFDYKYILEYYVMFVFFFCIYFVGGIVHPLIYSHPVTGDPTLCFHLGMTDHYIYDFGGPNVINGNWDKGVASFYV